MTCFEMTFVLIKSVVFMRSSSCTNNRRLIYYGHVTHMIYDSLAIIIVLVAGLVS